MKKANKILIVVIIIAMLLLGVGYAAMQNITLNITGTAKAGPAIVPELPTLGEAVSNANIGDYIDLGNDALANGLTTNDWRILYVDEQEGKVYAILADYLPNSTGYATKAGLDTSGTYGVYSNTDRATLLAGLKAEEKWEGLANGIEGAKVTGTPTWELITKSYNAKNNASLPTTSTGQTGGAQKFDSSTDGYDLYVPHTESSGYDSCYGYLLASPYSNSNGMWNVTYSGHLRYASYSTTIYSVRPVVCLPFNIQVEQKDGVWTVTNSPTPDPEPEPEQPTSGELGELVSNANIGDYIDLGNDALENGLTTNDWRILYVDEQEGKVYAILADYLPNSTGYAEKAGLSVSGNYEVSAIKDRAILLTGLTTVVNWEGLANGIEGATVTGSPTWALIVKSYNVKNSASLPTTPTSDKNFESSTNDYDLYVPHTEIYEACYGYWLASSGSGTNYMCNVNHTGILYNNSAITAHRGVRPVVCLPSNIQVEQKDGVWTVTNVQRPEEQPEKPTTSGKLGELVTNDANIGDYINLGNNVVGTSKNIDDWRILYVDDQEGKVYVILADYLPNSTGYAKSAGLSIYETYVVLTSNNISTMRGSLLAETYWKKLANGIEGATVTGTPTWELIAKSYNAKNSASLPTTPEGQTSGSQHFNKSTNGYDLYVPHSEMYGNCSGYWLATDYDDDNKQLWCVSYGGYWMTKSKSLASNTGNGVRPVVSLPFSTNVELVNGIWTVK